MYKLLVRRFDCDDDEPVEFVGDGPEGVISVVGVLGSLPASVLYTEGRDPGKPGETGEFSAIRRGGSAWEALVYADGYDCS